MRKWVVVGLAVLVAISAGTYLLSRPRLGSIEYHKKEISEIGVGRLDNWIRRSAPRPIIRMYFQRQLEKWHFHKDALMKLGYFETRWFLVTNRTPDDVCMALTTVSPADVLSGVFHVGTNSANEVGVTAPRDEMARWEKVIREFDVPSDKSESHDLRNLHDRPAAIPSPRGRGSG